MEHRLDDAPDAVTGDEPAAHALEDELHADPPLAQLVVAQHADALGALHLVALEGQRGLFETPGLRSPAELGLGALVAAVHHVNLGVLVHGSFL